MNYETLDLESLLSINDKNFDIYCCIGNKYEEIREYDKAIEYYKIAYELNVNDVGALEPLSRLISIYRKAGVKELELNEDVDYIQLFVKYVGIYNNLGWCDEIINYSDICKGVLGFGYDNPDGLDDDTITLCRFMVLAVALNSDNKVICEDAINFMLSNKYVNGYLIAARSYVKGIYHTKDITRGKQYYYLCHKKRFKLATYELGNLYLDENDAMNGYSYIFDAATNYHGVEFGYEYSSEADVYLEEGLACAQSLLALLLEYDYKGVSVKKDIHSAYNLYKSAYQKDPKEVGKAFLVFALRNFYIVDESILKELLSSFYGDMYYAIAYQKAIEFEMNDEAEVIYNNILDTNDYALIYELSMVVRDYEKSNQVNDILSKFTVKSDFFDYNHPYTEEYKSVMKYKEKIEDEIKKKVEEKEKKIEDRKKEDDEKLVANYKNVIKLIKQDKMITALVMLWKNNSKLGKEFPELYLILKLLNKENCSHFSLISNSEDDVVFNIKEREFLNRVIDMGNKIESALENRFIPDSLKKELKDFKSNSMYFKCLHDIRRIVVSHVNLYFNKQEKRKFYIRWTLLEYGHYSFHKLAMLYPRGMKFLIYEIGEAYGCVDSKYNDLVCKYKSCFIFNFKKRRQIIEEMKYLATASYPAYQWLKHHGIKCDKECIDVGREEYLGNHKVEFLDLE